MGSPVDVGSTEGLSDELDPGCASSSAGEVSYAWTAPAAGTYVFSTEGSAFDTVLYVLDGGCDSGSVLACDDNGGWFSFSSKLQLSLSMGQTVTIVIDGRSVQEGPYQLNILSLESCGDGDLDPTEQCDDGATTPLDGCAADCTLECPASNLGSNMGAHPGDTTGRYNAFQPWCAAAGGAGEFVYTFFAPIAGWYTFDTIGSTFDTVLYMLDGICSDEPARRVACRDAESGFTVYLEAGAFKTVVVDGVGDAEGGFILNIAEVPGLLFTDGFESGDVAAWSLAVP